MFSARKSVGGGDMSAQSNEVQQRLNFIDRTICHAAQACHLDTSIPAELKDFVRQLGLQANQAMQALNSRDETTVRKSVDALARLSHQAKSAIGKDVNYDLKCAVILTHIELSALKYRIDVDVAPQ
jgi:ABC-type Mn2+/Zn2+ transport system ATPase subunit